MSSKLNIQIVDSLFSKACKDLQEGRFTKSICFLFFSEGYSPLLLDAPESHYLELAGGVISSLNPEAYAYLYHSYELSEIENKGANHISAIFVSRDGGSWSLKRPYEERNGKIVFIGEVVLHTSLDVNISGRVARLFIAPNVSSDVKAKMKAIVDKVSPYLKVSKIPYSKVAIKKEH